MVGEEVGVEEWSLRAVPEAVRPRRLAGDSPPCSYAHPHSSELLVSVAVICLGHGLAHVFFPGMGTVIEDLGGIWGAADRERKMDGVLLVRRFSWSACGPFRLLSFGVEVSLSGIGLSWVHSQRI